uniref:TIA1 cytotoxic granule associated RNA binding protein like 1 n=1 Tax=Homo sapiens TaxID=9606 RepID=A0A087WX93_HUMAN
MMEDDGQPRTLHTQAKTYGSIFRKQYGV